MKVKQGRGLQGRNERDNLGTTAPMVGRISPGLNRVKVSENLDVTAVVPVAPVDTSLQGPGLKFLICA